MEERNTMTKYLKTKIGIEEQFSKQSPLGEREDGETDKPYWYKMTPKRLHALLTTN